MTEEQAERIANALEAIVVTLALIAGGDETAAPQGITVMTQQGPMEIR